MSSTRAPHAGTVAPPTAASHGVEPRPVRAPARRTLRPDRALVPAVAAVTVVSLAGSVLAVATGLSATWWDAVGPTARLSVPLPMNLALVGLAVAAAGTRRRLALVAAGLLAVAAALAVVSGFFDGGYAAALAPVGRAGQVALVVTLATTAGLAARRVGTVRRSRHG